MLATSTSLSFTLPNPDGAAGTHRVNAFAFGDPDAPPIFCVHGLTRNAHDFDFLATALSDTYRVICVDMPGRGGSDNLQNPSWYNYRTYALDMLAIAAELNITSVRWVGTSMGGIIGMTVAAFKPTLISKLVLNDVGSMIPAAALKRLAEYVGVKTRFATQAEYETVMRDIISGFGIKAPEHWQHVLQHSATRAADGSYTMNYDPAIALAFRGPDAPQTFEDADLSKLWEAVKCDTLILRGCDSDLLLKDTAEKMRTSRANVQLIEYPGIGHAPSLMDAHQIANVREFLAE